MMFDFDFETCFNKKKEHVWEVAPITFFAHDGVYYKDEKHCFNATCLQKLVWDGDHENEVLVKHLCYRYTMSRPSISESLSQALEVRREFIQFQEILAVNGIDGGFHEMCQNFLSTFVLVDYDVDFFGTYKKFLGVAKAMLEPDEGVYAQFGVNMKIPDAQMAVFTEFLGHLNHLTAQGVEVTHKIDLTSDVIIDLALIGGFCYGVYKRNVAVTAIGATLLLIRYTKFSSFVVDLVDSLGREEVEKQGPGHFSGTVLGGAGALFLMKCVDNLGLCCNWQDTVSTVVYNLTTSFNNGIKGSLESFLRLLTTMVSKIYCFATGKEVCPWSFIDMSSYECRKILDDISEFEAAKNVNEMSVVEASSMISDKIQKLEKVSGGIDMNSSLGAVVKSTLARLKVSEVELMTICKSVSSERPVPACYVFVGGAGIGKTMLIDTISDIITLGIASDYMKGQYKKHPELIKAAKFNFNQVDSFFSGYRNQPVFLADELDPNPQVPGVRSGPQFLINAVNSTSCPLNMADLGSKGTTYFTSKVVLGTSNNENWATLANMSCPEAFWRRVKFVHSVFLVDDFVRDNPHVSKANAIAANRRRQMDACNRFKRHRISFTDYVEEAYKYTSFRVKQLSAGNTTVHDGELVGPCELVQMVIDEVNQNEVDLLDRIGLSSRILEDYSNGFLMKDIKSRASRTRAEREAGPSVVDEVKAILLGKVVPQSVPSTLPADVDVDAILDDIGSPVVAQGPGVDKFKETVLTVAATIYIGCLSAVNKVKEGAKKIRKPAMKKIAIDEIDNAVALRNKFLEIVDGMTKDQLVRDAFRLFPSKDAAMHQLGLPVTILTESDWLTCDQTTVQPAERLWHLAVERLSMQLVVATTKETKLSIPWRAVTLSTGILLSMGLLIKLFYKGGSHEESQEQGDYPMKEKARKFKTRKLALDNLVKPEADTAQFESLLRNNLYTMVVRSKKVKDIVIPLFMVQNRMALMPQHVVDTVHDAFVEDSEAECHFYGCLQLKKGVPHMKKQIVPITNLIEEVDGEYRWRGGVTQYGASFETPTGTATSDLCLVTVPLSGKNAPPVPKAFFDSVAESHRECALAFQDSEFRPIEEEGVATTVREFSAINSLSKDKQKRYYFSDRLWKYDIRTATGWCGSPFFIQTAGRLQFAGIHVAGSGFAAGEMKTKTGYAISVDRETLDSCISLHAQRCMENGVVTLAEPDLDEVVQAQYGRYGLKDAFMKRDVTGSFGHQVMALAKRTPTATKTKLCKSPLYKMLSNTQRYQPAPLKVMRNGVDPMEMAQDGYGECVRAPKINLMLLCAQSYWNETGGFERKPWDKKSITFEEAVCPGEEWDCVRKISRKTSPGFPFNLCYKNGKKEIFGDGDEYVFDTPAWKLILEELETCENLILSGKRPLFVCQSFLKDERRPIEKALAGKSRLISGAPLSYTILVRKYTLGFVNWFNRHRIRNGSCVGVNPFSDEWNDIARKHGYVTQESFTQARMFAGDHSGYDKNLHYEDVRIFGMILNWFYDDDGTDTNKIRNALLEEIAFSRHVCLGEILEWIGSNTSGNPLTVVINTIINILKLRYIACLKHLEWKGIKVSDYTFQLAVDELFGGPDPEIVFTCYGDDMKASVKEPERYPWFNAKVFGDGFLEHLGTVFTDELKGDLSSSLRSILDCSFLKRGFAFNIVAPGKKNRLAAPLSVETIIESVRWYRASDEWLDSWSHTINTAIFELSLHKPSVYYEVGTKIVKAVNGLKGSTPVGVFRTLPPQSVAQERAMDLEFEL